MALFRKFSPEEDISKSDSLKSSVARKLRKDLVDMFPTLEANFDEMFPKKEAVTVYRTRDQTQFVAYNGEIVFFAPKNGPFLPTVRFVHRFPDMMPKLQVDRGAIPFVLKGAPIMAVGITSPGGKIFQELPQGAAVAIVAEGKTHAIAVGITAMSTQEMPATKKGAGVHNLHQMGDGLWFNNQTP